MPKHPIYVYFGRDLSNLAVPLPRLRDGRALFEQANSGDMSDVGFGPGVRVAHGIRTEVAEAERVLRTWVVEYDGSRQ